MFSESDPERNRLASMDHGRTIVKSAAMQRRYTQIPKGAAGDASPELGLF